MTHKPLTNFLTFDVEDWHQLVEWKVNGLLPPCSANVLRQTYDILENLSQRGVRATFFVLGLVAEAHPKLIRDIADAGHEIGSHGWSHQLIYRQTRKAFQEETHRSKTVLEDALGRRIHGYRAAEFSITESSKWALEVLVEEGFTYDSSIFPVASKGYGAASAPLGIHTIKTSAGEITEVPLTAVERYGRRWPVGGGGYFRLLPYAITRAAIRDINAQGRPANVYFHPYEFSQELMIPKLASAVRYVTGARYLLFHNINRGLIRRRFYHLLTDFQFSPIKELISHGH